MTRTATAFTRSDVRCFSDYSDLLSEDERFAWHIPDPMSVSEWAQNYRKLTARESSEPGPWDNARTPYLKEPMDSLSDPTIQQVTFKKPTQVGGTEIGLNFIGWIMGHDPGPTLFVLPDIDLAKRFSRRRVWSVITGTEQIQQYLTNNSDDLSRLYYQLIHMDLRLAGAGSPASLASDPIRYLICDEVNKYPPYSGKEADPISLARERQNTYKFDKKIYIASTPTTPDGTISQEHEKSDRRQYYVPCPHCGEHQTLKWKQVKFDSKALPESIRIHQSAFYECSECHGQIHDSDKPDMLAKGIWCPDGCKVTKAGKIEGKQPKTTHRGYHINAIYSPWVTFSELAAEWLDAQGRDNKLMNFINSKLAEEYEEKEKETKEDQIRHLIGDYPQDFAPDGVEILLGEVDVQLDHFYCAVWGWGYEEESWLVTKRRVESWQEVEKIMFKTEYETSRGGKLPVRAVAIDTGYKASEVYKFCAKWRERTFPVKGQDDLKHLFYRPSKLDKMPDGSPLPGGLVLWHVNKFYYNDKLDRFLNSKGRDSGQMHFYHGIDDDYLKQITSEHKVRERGRNGKYRVVWKMRPGVNQNHYRDTRIYGMCLADILKVWTWTKEDLSPQATPSQSRSQQGDDDDFIGGNKNFIGGDDEWL